MVLAWTDDEADPQYELSMACLKALEASVDACGRRLQVHKLPIPKTPICVTEEDLKGYEFEPGEDLSLIHISWPWWKSAWASASMDRPSMKRATASAEAMSWSKMCIRDSRKYLAVLAAFMDCHRSDAAASDNQ